MSHFLSYNPDQWCYLIERNEARRSPVALTADEVYSKTAHDTDQSFEAVFQEHWSRVFGVLYRLVGNRAEAEDLALETFWRLYQHPPAHEDNLTGWLYRVATNLGYNALRALKRREHYEQKAGIEVLDDAPPSDPSVEVERAQNREQVSRVLVRMKPRSARILILRHSGLSYAEIAAALNIHPGSMGTLLARAEREFEQRFMREGR